MGSYSFIRREIHRVIVDYTEDFDTTDQEEWDDLLARAQEESPDFDEADFPEEAPIDPDLWLQLFKLVNPIELAGERTERWISDEKGFTEVEFHLRGESGHIFLSET